MSTNWWTDGPNAAYLPNGLPSGIKRNKIQTYAATAINLKNITQKTPDLVGYILYDMIPLYEISRKGKFWALPRATANRVE